MREGSRLSGDVTKSVSLTDVQMKFLERYVDKGRAGARANGPQTKELSIVTLQKLRLAYTETRKAAVKELQSLEKAITAYFADEPKATEIAVVAKRVHEGLHAFDDALVDKLDEALNAEDPEVRRHCEVKAAEQIKSYLAAIETDPILKLLDNNPIRPVAVQANMRKTLIALSARLG